MRGKNDTKKIESKNYDKVGHKVSECKVIPKVSQGSSVAGSGHLNTKGKCNRRRINFNPLSSLKMAEIKWKLQKVKVKYKIHL
jgi:hypothetical protein